MKSFTLDGKRIRVDRASPVDQINRIIDRLHVSTTDEEVKTEIAHRAQFSSTPSAPALVENMQAIALHRHRKNQALYRAVQTGTFR